MKIIKLLTYTVILIILVIGYRVAYQSGYVQGRDDTKIEINRNQLLVQITDLRYLTSTYKRLYESCAGENIQVRDDLENMLFNLKYGEL